MTTFRHRGNSWTRGHPPSTSAPGRPGASHP